MIDDTPTLKNTIGNLFYDMSYEEGLRFLVVQKESSSTKLFLTFKTELEQLLDKTLENLQESAEEIAPMGFSFPLEAGRFIFESSRGKQSRIFFEKLYWDLFHKDEGFKESCLEYIDFHTGQLSSTWVKYLGEHKVDYERELARRKAVMDALFPSKEDKVNT